MTEHAHELSTEQVAVDDAINRPDQQDIIDTLIEELRERDAAIVNVNDQRMYFKAQAKKLQRRAEVAEMNVSSIQASLDQARAELNAPRADDASMPIGVAATEPDK